MIQLSEAEFQTDAFAIFAATYISDNISVSFENNPKYMTDNRTQSKMRFRR